MTSSNVSIIDSLIVAAIDFGTTFSGWAYSNKSTFMTEPTKAFFKQWHSGSGMHATEKTPTIALVKPNGKELEAFGYEAENRYKELIEEGHHRSYYYFRHFKMKLHKQLSETIDLNLMLTDEMGKTLPALDVFVMAIKYLVNDWRSVVKKRLTGDELKESEVHWVLTVPAIWTDQAKQFMRKATEMAGIDRYQLSIALEPEAASVLCRYMPLDKSMGRVDVSISSLPVGTKYLILDAGGGTIDTTVHEILDNQQVKEVVAASGGGWGGTKVDEAFEDLVKGLVSKEVYEDFKHEQTEDWMEMLRDFEMKKRSIFPKKEGRLMMKFPVSLSGMFEQKTGHVFADYIRNCCSHAKDVAFVGDKIKIQNELFQRLFDDSCVQIIKHMHGVIQDNNLHDLDLILMVGGYSESLVLQHAVTEAFPTMRLIIPHEASTAILKGALICGRRPEFITERVLKYTYGIETKIPFIEEKHPEYCRFNTDMGDYCDNVFSKHVTKGEIVKVGEAQVQQHYSPIFDDQTELVFNIYASELMNPEFVDEDECIKIGSLSVDILPGDVNSNNVLISFNFSGTEIVVEAFVENTGEKRQVVVNFLG